MTYCKVIEAKSEMTLMGSEIWNLTLACGRTLQQSRRKAGTRHIKPALKRVQCDCKETAK